MESYTYESQIKMGHFSSTETLYNTATITWNKIFTRITQIRSFSRSSWHEWVQYLQKWTRGTEKTKEQQDVTGPRAAYVCKRDSAQLCLHYCLQDLQSELNILKCRIRIKITLSRYFVSLQTNWAFPPLSPNADVMWLCIGAEHSTAFTSSLRSLVG